jgi:hypothetical protein
MRLVLAAAVALCLSVAGPARAVEVDVALVLAADVSISVNDDEFRLQRQGYAAAISDPRMLDAIRSGRSKRIAACFVEWSGRAEQRVVVDWTVIGDEGAAAKFAAGILAAPRSFAGATSIDGAINFGVLQFSRSGVETERHVIDISGDGTSNSGRLVTEARDQAESLGVTINGLAIINERMPAGDPHTHPPGGLPAYYRRFVIGGPGAFVLVANDFNTFRQSIAEKLLGDIASVPRSDKLYLAKTH